MCETNPLFSGPKPTFRVRPKPWQSSASRPLKIAVVGKGGVGKTTITAALARCLAKRGARVTAIDADPDANLASALPLDDDEIPTPLAQQNDLLRKAAQGNEIPTGMIQLNPDIRALLPHGSASWGGGHHLLAIGWSNAGGQGCYCAEHAVLKRILAQASRREADITLIDSEAGLEHLARGTVAGVDLILIVIEPGLRSVETAQSIRKLATDLAIPNIHTVVSGIRNRSEHDKVVSWLSNWQALAYFPFDEEIRSADLEGRVPELSNDFLAASEQLTEAVLALATPLEKQA